MKNNANSDNIFDELRTRMFELSLDIEDCTDKDELVVSLEDAVNLISKLEAEYKAQFIPVSDVLDEALSFGEKNGR